MIGARAEVTTAPAIHAASVSKSYGPRRDATFALDRISLAIAPGEFVCMVGASGCGKSTLLAILAGLDTPDRGEVQIQGRTASMFQGAALFGWLTVARNIELALRFAGVPRALWGARVETLLRTVHLEGAGDRRPHELSGGMQQRAALARALAQGADILLMDEPFGALDAITRDLLHDELERLWIETGTTILFVTHDVREAVRLGDRVIVLSSRPGRVVADIAVPLPRPRSADAAGLAAHAAHITGVLREEVRKHAHDPA